MWDTLSEWTNWACDAAVQTYEAGKTAAGYVYQATKMVVTDTPGLIYSMAHYTLSLGMGSLNAFGVALSGEANLTQYIRDTATTLYQNTGPNVLIQVSAFGFQYLMAQLQEETESTLAYYGYSTLAWVAWGIAVNRYIYYYSGEFTQNALVNSTTANTLKKSLKHHSPEAASYLVPCYEQKRMQAALSKKDKKYVPPEDGCSQEGLKDKAIASGYFNVIQSAIEFLKYQTNGSWASMTVDGLHNARFIMGAATPGLCAKHAHDYCRTGLRATIASVKMMMELLLLYPVPDALRPAIRPLVSMILTRGLIISWAYAPKNQALFYSRKIESVENLLKADDKPMDYYQLYQDLQKFLQAPKVQKVLSFFLPEYLRSVEGVKNNTITSRYAGDLYYIYCQFLSYVFMVEGDKRAQLALSAADRSKYAKKLIAIALERKINIPQIVSNYAVDILTDPSKRRWLIVIHDFLAQFRLDGDEFAQELRERLNKGLIGVERLPELVLCDKPLEIPNLNGAMFSSPKRSAAPPSGFTATMGSKITIFDSSSRASSSNGKTEDDFVVTQGGAQTPSSSFFN